ncbi:MAG: hydrolase [Rhodoglobus sp.]|nr:hydrolase [Rhodoglobus sp.]
MVRLRTRAPAREEAAYRTRRINGAIFFTSRRAFDDLSIVVKRFPPLADVEDGPTFVLVHGIGVSSRYFQPAAAELAKRGTVYLVDLPGHGAAPDPKREVTIADHAGVLGKFLAAAELQNPVIVGHSMGAQVVSRLAVDMPEISDHIVLMAPTMPPEARTFWRGLRRLLHDGLREPPAVNVIVMSDYLLRCGVPYFVRQLPNLFDDRIEERLPRVRAKTLVIRGHRDPIVLEPWAAQVTALVPGARLATVRGPHVVMFTDPVRVAELIANHADR